MRWKDEPDLTRRVTQRAKTAAVPAELGKWRRTVRVNRTTDESAISAAGVVVIAPWPLLAVGVFAPVPWFASVLCVVAGVVFLGVGGVLFVRAVGVVWRGEAVAHLFDLGLVLERPRGALAVLPYATTTVEFVTWEESDSESTTTRVRLWLTLPDGRVVDLKANEDNEIRVLETIAVHCGLSAGPRPVDVGADHPTW